MVTNRDRKSFGSSRKNSKFAQTTGTVDVFGPCSGISGPTSSRTSAYPNLHERWTQPPSREMPSCSAIDLAEIRRSSKISSRIWSIISGVVTVLGRPGRGTSQVEKSPRLNWTTEFFTVVNVPLMFLWEWREFPSAPCLALQKERKKERKLDDSSCLHVVEIARVAWHASFQPL